METQRKETTIEGQTISYLEREGSADKLPMLFLHGWGGCAESFLPLWEELSRSSNRRFIAIDFPGFGHSPEPAVAWDVTAYAQLIVDFLASIGVKNVDLVNHSFGGRITTMLLAQHPELVRKAFYIAPAGIRHEKRGVAALAASAKKVFELPVFRSLFPKVRSIGYRLIGGHDYLQVSGVMKETFKSVVAEDLSHFFGQIATPAHVIIGKNDTYVPYTDAKIMAEQMQNTTYTVIDDGRHGIHKTHADVIAKSINAFIE